MRSASPKTAQRQSSCSNIWLAIQTRCKADIEEKNTVLGGRTGYADVFKRGAFARENKAPGKNLGDALTQLLRYSSALSNPPILVVRDRLTFLTSS